MKTLLFLCCSLYFLNSFAQTCNPPADISDPAQRREYCKLFNRQTRNLTFVQQTLNYSSLSYACPPAFDLGSPKNWYILSADIIPEFVIGGKWMPFPIHLTARFKVRIFHEDTAAGDVSLPVRTPSFMPGATIYFPLSYMDDQTKKINYLSLSVFHHSNGQDGKEFKSDGTPNFYNGNFSTNYIEPAFHFRKRKYYDLQDANPCNDALEPYNDFYGRVGYEIHFGTADALKSSYGNERLNLTFGYIQVKSYCDKILNHQIGDSYYRERNRFVLNCTLIAGSRDYGLSAVSKRINADLNYYWRIPSSPNTSLFASAGYYGSDPYNIYYFQDYFFVRAGVALGFFVAPKMLGMK